MQKVSRNEEEDSESRDWAPVTGHQKEEIRANPLKQALRSHQHGARSPCSFGGSPLPAWRFMGSYKWGYKSRVALTTTLIRGLITLLIILIRNPTTWLK